MLALLIAVFFASVLGSMHCVGMCGPLAILASSSKASGLRRLHGLLAYHGGRIVAYSVLGWMVGAIGMGVHQTGNWMGLQRLATQLAGGSMLVIGLLSIVRLVGGAQQHIWLPKKLQSTLAQGHAWARQQPPLRRAASVGMLTAILPCGWLYAFLLVAAGTANPLQGSLVMAVFGLGSVPALVGFVSGAQVLAGRFRRAIPWCSAILVTLVGFSTLAFRSHVDLSQMSDRASNTSQHLIDHVLAMDPEELPCCDPKARGDG